MSEPYAKGDFREDGVAELYEIMVSFDIQPHL